MRCDVEGCEQKAQRYRVFLDGKYLYVQYCESHSPDLSCLADEHELIVDLPEKLGLPMSDGRFKRFPLASSVNTDVVEDLVEIASRAIDPEHQVWAMNALMRLERGIAIDALTRVVQSADSEGQSLAAAIRLSTLKSSNGVDALRRFLSSDKKSRVITSAIALLRLGELAGMRRLGDILSQVGDLDEDDRRHLVWALKGEFRLDLGDDEIIQTVVTRIEELITKAEQSH